MVLQGKKLRGTKKMSYIVGDFVNRGGEGEIYRVQGDDSLVIKIYNDRKMQPTQYVPDMRSHLEKKLQIMVQYPVSCYNAQNKLCIAWPQDVVYDNYKFVGYVMPFVTTDKKIYDACREAARLQMFPNYTWHYAVIIALNLSWTVNNIHQNNYCIGDFNPNNILVDERGNVTLIDADSFDIVDPKRGNSYKCMVGVQEMLAPELQGRGNLQSPKVKFTKETDNFSLAIHIFNLLMNNCHPFNCVNISAVQSSVNMAPLSVDISEGHFYYGRPLPPNIKLPDTAPDYQMLPAYIRDLFERTFRYTAQTAFSSAASRTTAKEWLLALDRLNRDSYSVCSRDRHHVYLKAYRHCPWCRLANSGGSKLHSSKMPGRLQNLIANKNWGLNKSVRRNAAVLYVVCTLVGIGSGVLLAPLLQYFLQQKLNMDFTLLLLRGICGVVGGIEGPVIAHFFEEKYIADDKGWKWLFVSLAMPLAITATALIVGLVIFLVILAIYIVVGIFAIFCLLAVCGGA